jgi:molecular chaperone DnaK (HSP70)
MSTDSAEASEAPSRYVVGIDLGTTNSAMAYVDTASEPWQVRTFAVPQLVAAGVVESRETLPSFHYQPAEAEFAPGSLRLPWTSENPDHIVGVLARDQGAIAPGRLIISAKSWLCHSGVDRLAELLPWHGAADVDRLSPVEVSARYLSHLRAAWNQRFPRDPLEAQDIVLTLPASFDEVARELTVKAAARAELPRVVLIEEPQAAIYHWIDAHHDQWQQLVKPGQKILICDVGGGTSDFTLIHVGLDSQGKTQFQRVAVGEHLILGGDNLDLALAHHVEQKLLGDGKLEPRQWAVLVQSCRKAKETLLGDHPPERLTMSLPGSGSKLIGGALQVEVSREEVREWLVEGFFPLVKLDDKPLARRSGFQEFSLPYAPDAAITRYLAAFLTAHRHVTAPGASPSSAGQTALARSATGNDHDLARPDAVLFNGGVFDAPALRERLLEVLGSWFPSPPGSSAAWRPQVLQNDRRDLAVARGAAYYGLVRRGFGVRIAAGLARSYFIGVATAESEPSPDVKEWGQAPRDPPVFAAVARPARSQSPFFHKLSAVCLMPAGVEEGQVVDLNQRRFDLLIRQPVEFPLYSSSTQLLAHAGDIVPVDPEQMTSLPPIRTALQTGKKSAGGESVAVTLHVRLTEIGTLELWCGEIDGPRTWKLQFDVRAATRTDLAGHGGAGERSGIVEQATLDACRGLIERTFGPVAADEREKPEQLVKRLAEVIGLERSEWPPSLLRELWETTLEFEPGRKLSPAHEGRWLSLLGFALRPGYGLAVDDWRVAQTRRVVTALRHNNPNCRAEWWILWRRIAGGLPAGQQRALAEPLLADVRAAQRALAKGRGAEMRVGSHEAAELWRLLGSLELLTVADKRELGDALLALGPREKVAAVQNAAIWALGRVGARAPFYGPLNTVVPADVAAGWIAHLLKLKTEPEMTLLALMQLARRTGDRYRDISGKLRDQVAAWLKQRNAAPHLLQLVEEGGELEAAEQGLIFGESLPQGLRVL